MNLSITLNGNLSLTLLVTHNNSTVFEAHCGIQYQGLEQVAHVQELKTDLLQFSTTGAIVELFHKYTDVHTISDCFFYIE